MDRILIEANEIREDNKLTINQITHRISWIVEQFDPYRTTYLRSKVDSFNDIKRILETGNDKLDAIEHVYPEMDFIMIRVGILGVVLDLIVKQIDMALETITRSNTEYSLMFVYDTIEPQNGNLLSLVNRVDAVILKLVHFITNINVYNTLVRE